MLQSKLEIGPARHIGGPDSFTETEFQSIISFIAKEHYLGYPRNKDGSVNPYQYCFGLGYIEYRERLWAAFTAGLYPNQGFWKKHFPILVGRMGIPWIFRHAANIYRIVAFNGEDASTLLSDYEHYCRDIDKRISLIFALPTRKEKDAVCNWDWFSSNGFKGYGYTQDGARVFAKDLGFTPIERSPFFKPPNHKLTGFT